MNLKKMRVLVFITAEPHHIIWTQPFFGFTKHIPGRWSSQPSRRHTRYRLFPPQLVGVVTVCLFMSSSMHFLTGPIHHRGRSDLHWCLGGTGWSVSFALPIRRPYSLEPFSEPRFLIGHATPTGSQIVWLLWLLEALGGISERVPNLADQLPHIPLSPRYAAIRFGILLNNSSV
ncbi:hypothetical protein F5146DRAFT_245916 [Armillaria mellea]|nr:hypothetical protein F5146DRAFT_245916 [Armillaria mellea]